MGKMDRIPEGTTVGECLFGNTDPNVTVEISEAVRKVQKNMKPATYLVCAGKCALGISSNETTTPPHYIARYCRYWECDKNCPVKEQINNPKS